MATSDVQDILQSSAIEPPPNFPVVWERPDDAQLFWHHERMHFPDPVTPLSEDVWAVCLNGCNRTMAVYDLGLRQIGRRINSYHYEAIVPLEASPEEQTAQSARSAEKLEAAMGCLGEAWATELLPEIKAHLEFWESFDLAGASTPALIAHLGETIARTERLWEIHDLCMVPVFLAISMFDDLYRDLFGNEQALQGYGLLHGFDSKTHETDRALWQLSRQARNAPEVLQVLAEQPAGNVVPALEQSDTGRAFLASLRAFLHEYGQRTQLALSRPRWIEEPTPAIAILQEYIAQPDRDHQAERAALAETREQLVAQTRQQLHGYPQPVVSRFEFLLKAAQAATVLSEDHAFWIDMRGLYRFRLVVLEFGRRFAETGVLEGPEDIFYLTLEEVRQTAESLPRLDRRLLVAGRRAELAYFSTIEPPAMLGTLPDGPPPDDALSRAIDKFYGSPPAPAAEADIVTGHAGSPGVVRGTARVIHSLAEADRLQRGEILVAEATLPEWTPLFATAAAVVTDIGGILSHSAIVAREYCIPAVVGASIATTSIRDGQLIEVDGTHGIVRLAVAD
jgi:pyruvate,water dikinase